MTDPMQRLRAADPARRAPLDDLDPAGWTALRDGVLATGPAAPGAAAGAPARGARRWRLGRNTTIALGVGIALTAGGLATIPGFFGGAGDGPNCLRTWGDAAEVTGPWLTGDPVADCRTLWAEAGIEPPGDLVGFTVQGLAFVAPADEVPQGATSLDGAPILTPAEVELQQSGFDTVDGGMVCRTVDEEAAWAQAELDRLGLATTWTVRIDGYPDEPRYSEDGFDRPCAGVDTMQHGLVSVYPAQDAEKELFFDGNWRAHLLREQITDRCVTVEEARAVADTMLAQEEHHWPTTTVVDESADCARVDLSIGGSIQVTVYGPTTVG